MIFRPLMLLLILALMTACGDQITPTSIPTDEPTSEPTEVIETTEESQSASAGQVIFEQFYDEVGFACVTCHYFDSDERLLGPGLMSLAERFETYDVDSESLEDYIRESILDPASFIVPDESPFPENIMPRTYGEIFSEDELDALVEYILTF